MEQLKIGVIGVGTMGQRHCRIYSNLRRAQLVGVCDINPKVGHQVAQQYEVPFYEQLDDFLEHVDAVSIATPTPLHFDIAARCLAEGVHVLVEKPITETLEQAETLMRAAESSERVFQVGHIERFNPAYIELKNVLTDTDPLAVNLRRLSPNAGSNTDVDVVLDLMIHDTNLVLDLVRQEPVSVNAHGLTIFSSAIDHAVAQLYFGSSKPLITMTASRITEHKVRSIEVTTHNAYVECDLLNKSLLLHRRTVGEYLSHNHRAIKYRQESIVECIHVPTSEPLFLELQHFVECVLDNKQPAVSCRDGLEALRLAMVIRDAICERLVNGKVSDKPKLINGAIVKPTLALA
jgi:predicted dehydrogenase